MAAFALGAAPSPCSRAPGAVGVDQSTDAVTSGRSTLVEGGVELARDRPMHGLGRGRRSGASTAARRRPPARAPSAASHTIPITVAAEQGIGGLRAVPRACRASRSAGCCAARAQSIARAAVAAAFVALVVHTLLYAAFLEDPLAWALLAVGAALRARGRSGAPVAGGSTPPPGGRGHGASGHW